MRSVKRSLLATVFAVPMILGIAPASYADTASEPPVDAELQPCPTGYTGVKVVVYINGNPTGIVICQNIRPL